MTVVSHRDSAPEAAEKTRLLLADLWRRNRPVIEERLAILDRAASRTPMPEDYKAEALDVSHKLSGSLGMFGFEQGTVAARELEEILDSAAPETARVAELTQQLREMLLPAS